MTGNREFIGTDVFDDCGNNYKQRGGIFVNYWAVGASWGGTEDVSGEFFKKKIWYDGYAHHGDEQNKSMLDAVSVGDVLIMKSSATKGKGHSVTFTKVKGIGIITDKINWYRFKVNWLDVKNLPKDFDNISYRKTIEQLRENDEIYKFVNDVMGQNNMNIIIDYLKANKNLILTGAPGTGKTYLAKEIAESIVKENSASGQTPIKILKNAIDNFKPDLEAREEKENLLKMFLKQFPKEKIQSLTLDEYCAGKGDRNNFCWWIETGLKTLGKYAPGSARSYLIYWSKKKEEYSKHGYIKDEADNRKALEIVLSDIHGLIGAGNSKDYEDKFGNGLILKILNTYYPEVFFPINSTKHMDNVIRLFNLKTDSTSVSDKNKVINNFYKAQCKSLDITPFEFQRILYDLFNIAEGEILYEDKIVSDGDISFVQFHPSYDYTDFVEGLRPVKNEDNNDIGFELKNGIFKQFCKKAKNNPNKNYVFIIDEINRGEISKIFGELFFSIDPGYRGEKGKVKTQYSNMQTEDTLFSDIDEDYFYVPENVYIIGTMNDIDRSVESFDFAMRRRFVWKEIKAEDTQNMLDSITDKIDVSEAKKRMNSLNAEIEKMPELGSHYQIGAAYFLKLKNYNGDFNRLWDLHLKPLLSEYLRGLQGSESKLKELQKAYETDN